jgi:MoxR-like ATPase
MGYPYYTGLPGIQPTGGADDLPATRRLEHDDPAGYLADPGLVDAVNVALLLGQPLLLTGEPGTGKTQLASSLAWQLALGEPLMYETKSTSTGHDLFYTYNTLGRFHAAQTGEGSRRAIDYITYNALGIAILRANPEEVVAPFLPADLIHGGRRRSVVLIDEVDKAPRDFPNDILNEVEGMYFRIPELGSVRIAADPEMRPILVITSNSEKNLPDAFLRRCIYYHIPFPDRERLAQIVEARLGRPGGRGERFLHDALEVFGRLREPASGLRKRPATAELLGWLVALRDLVPGVPNPLAERPELVFQTVSILVKTMDDYELAREILERWTKEAGRGR